MEQTPLVAQKRTVLGKKVKNLRKQGVIPAHVFGHKIPTIHIQVNGKDFAKVFEKTGETGIISLEIEGDKRPVLVKNIQVHHITDDPLHIDFYQVNLSEKVKVNIPLEITGEAPAESKKVGVLLTPVSELEIEALPTDIPENIEVDVSKLENIGDEIRVKDLPIDKSKVEVKTDEELVVASIGELISKEQQELEAQMEAEKAEAEATTEGAEGEQKKEGEEGAEGEAAPEGEESKEEKGNDKEEKKENKKDE
ncbi:MAG TPA: 50S ribosomal protein L25 [Candidatus Saccharimonadales bacterium]|nr:50S ribosomal protein L25 [Candidatus Saccharimonadales bacterium]